MFVFILFLHPDYLWVLWTQADSKWLVTWQFLCIWLLKTAETLAIALSGSHFSITTLLNLRQNLYKISVYCQIYSQFQIMRAAVMKSGSEQRPTGPKYTAMGPSDPNPVILLI